eukprot:9485156-Pyramimonas_sp.AAC.1
MLRLAVVGTWFGVFVTALLADGLVTHHRALGAAHAARGVAKLAVVRALGRARGGHRILVVVADVAVGAVVRPADEDK